MVRSRGRANGPDSELGAGAAGPAPTASRLALVNTYRLLAATQILRAVELALGQRTKIYLFIRCSSPTAGPAALI